ncbi:alpha/beta fold hydrolase [Nocardia sp. R7R-8]|uniref:alpha/beta fold hydrolase n=1 Tax=Nocardia sp. R7R-8 TaxID=3459304 RepID=UPI00403DA20B
MSEPKSRTVSAAGHRIHLEELGEGPIVLMIHGFPESPRSWRHQMRPLADAGYRAVAIDQLGYGRSSKPLAVEESRITRLVDIAVGVVHALGESTAVIVGHDWGAPVAWTAAWTRPDVFTAVVGASVPFGGRGMTVLPGSARGEVRPSIIETEIAGPGLIWYQQFIQKPQAAEPDAESDVRRFLASVYYSLSAAAIPEVPTFDSRESLVEWLRGTGVCLAPGQVWSDRLATPDGPLEWLPDAEFERTVAQYEYTGFTGPMNSYRTNDLDWELLAAFDGKPLEVPALYIGADRDVCTLWGRESLELFPKLVSNYHRSVILDNCGHWIQQEKPDEFNRELLDFLKEASSLRG